MATQHRAVAVRDLTEHLIRKALVSSLLATLLAAISAGAAEADTFTGSRGPGWSDFVLFPGTTIAVENNAYRLSSPPSPALGSFGPGRVASFQAGSVYTDFLVSVDIVDWNPLSSPQAQAFGILSRASNIGPGTTDGYALTITTSGTLDISQITNEGVSAALDDEPIVGLSNALDYRMVFQGVGSQLTGQLFLLTNLLTPIATVSASDALYSGGVNGLFAFNQELANQANAGPADATFDNYLATVPEPAGLAAILLLAPFLGRRRLKSRRE